MMGIASRRQLRRREAGWGGSRRSSSEPTRRNWNARAATFVHRRADAALAVNANRERVTRQHHQRDQPANRPLAIGVGPEQLGHIADRCGFRLDPATFGAQGGAFRLEIGQGCSVLPTMVMSGTGVSRGVRVSAHRWRFCRVGPGSFTPSPSQIPDLNLSIHPARVIARRLPPSAESSGSSRFDPVGPSSTAMTCPLCSTGVTPLHHYYEAVRPSPAHRYFRPRGWSHLRLFPWHRRSGSHVPYKSPIELRAAYMPDAAWAVSGHPPS